MAFVCFFVLVSCHTVTTGLRGAAGEAVREGLPVLFSEDFEHGSSRWIAVDPSAWKVVEDNGSRVYSLFRKSDYNPPHRSPLNIALVKDLKVDGDFVVEAEMKQTGREYGHRDMCIFFGYQDPANFYYVHFATRADDHANSVFIVDDAPRVSIAQERTDGTDWGRTYHKVKIVRRVETGAIEVYFDDMTNPVMRAVDKTFTWGGIGFGSFDDTGNIDNVRIWGRAWVWPGWKNAGVR